MVRYLVGPWLVLPQIMNTIRNAVWRGYELLVTFANFLQSPFLLALRVYFFWQLFLTGKGKLSNIGKVIDFFTSLGIPAPNLNAYFVSGLECFGGLLLIIGLASRPLALLIVISMSVAYLTADFEAISSIFSNPDKFVKADPFPFLLAALIVLVFGPGLFSIDALLKRWLVGTAPVQSQSSAGRSFRQTDRG
jgi:putative oxidoreductase